MLTINVITDDDVDVTLRYENKDGMKIVFSPENINHINKIEIGEEGSFDTNPCNGSFYFHWTQNQITFEVGKFGDGNGGSIIVKLPNDAETMSSLIECLTIWKEAVQSIQPVHSAIPAQPVHSAIPAQTMIRKPLKCCKVLNFDQV